MRKKKKKKKRRKKTYTRAVLGTGLVGRVLGHATILVHGDKVEGRVETALDGGQVDIKGELIVHEGEHLVLGGAVHEVEAGANVGAVLVLGNELEGQGITAGGGAVRGAVVGALELALGGAVGGRAADIGPLVAVVAVLAVAVVQPAPVGIDDHLGTDRGAGCLARALLPRHLGVRLRSLLADLLGRSQAHEEGRRHKDGLHGELEKDGTAKKNNNKKAREWTKSVQWLRCARI